MLAASSTVDPQDADFAGKFGRAAASRLGDPMQYSLESLCYWSLLWLLLNAHGPAEQTAVAIAAAISSLSAVGTNPNARWSTPSTRTCVLNRALPSRLVP